MGYPLKTYGHQPFFVFISQDHLAAMIAQFCIFIMNFRVPRNPSGKWPVCLMDSPRWWLSGGFLHAKNGRVKLGPWSGSRAWRIEFRAVAGIRHLRWTPDMSGWWFGTFFIFPYVGNNHPNWLRIFQRASNHQPDVFWGYGLKSGNR